jgi:hypothetical protein
MLDREAPTVETVGDISAGDEHSATLESIEIAPAEEAEPLTEENIEFLSQEVSANEEKSAEAEEEEENIEDGISEQPLENVFTNWNAAPDADDSENSAEENEGEKVSARSDIPDDMKEEIKSVLSYMDQLLENLPEDKIAEFAQSEQFETYKKLFAELGLS